MPPHEINFRLLGCTIGRTHWRRRSHIHHRPLHSLFGSRRTHRHCHPCCTGTGFGSIRIGSGCCCCFLPVGSGLLQSCFLGVLHYHLPWEGLWLQGEQSLARALLGFDTCP